MGKLVKGGAVMPRKRKVKDIHTRPDMAGPENLTEERIKRDKQEGADEIMSGLIDLYKITGEHLKEPRKSAWTAEELHKAVLGYFEFCEERSLKPTKSAIQMYIGVSSSQYYDWGKKEEVYGDISATIRWANYLIENQYVNRGEKYPTFNMFMLKSKHGYEDKSTIEVTNTTSEDVAERVKQLGLSKDGE
jgi:hypothetical protein